MINLHIKSKWIFLIAFFIIIFNFSVINAENSPAIPDWFKNNANWWSNNMISDKEYVESVQWLIKKNHIVVSDLDTYIQLDNTIIPSWLRMVNTFWANDEINDDDYVPTIKFLAKISTTELLQTVHDTNQTIDFLERDFPGYSPLFRTFAYQKDLVVDPVGILTSYTTQFELKSELMEVYNEIGSFDNNHKTVVVIPIFTSSAYWDPGFYTYFSGECDSSCLTTKIEYEKGLTANASDKAVGVLRLLGYDLITDIDLDKNPEILLKYDSVILLHNEYVTKKEFDAITNHPHVLYLYPNALYAEISVDYDNDSITLIRGHSYPEPEIKNGFDWEYDNTHPYEFDRVCNSWEFYDIDNGIMLNCYPENSIIFTNKTLLKMIKDF